MAKRRVPEDLHEWISFEDPSERRTWMFDATFLLSDWTCIFGTTCKGVLTEDATKLQQGCCSYGAHFIDAADVATVITAVDRLTAADWQFVELGRSNGFLGEEDGTTVTKLVDDACIFLNRPGFVSGAGCAFHVAATKFGERPMDWKPDVCWQLPLRLHEETDQHGYVTSTLREWKRRDWGEGGDEFHWWCTESEDAFVGVNPVYDYLRDEITEMIGVDIYDLLAKQLKRRTAKPTTLPHPATRK
jgi:hypothetical protein